jgi:hypothetical protein
MQEDVALGHLRQRLQVLLVPWFGWTTDGWIIWRVLWMVG